MIGFLLARLLYLFVSAALRKLRKERTIKERQKDGVRAFDLAILSLVNLKNFSYWVNSIGFIISFCILSYVFYAQPKEASPDERGAIESLLLIMSLLFLLMNLVIRLKKTYDPAQDQQVKSTSLSDQYKEIINNNTYYFYFFQRIMNRAERKAQISERRKFRHKILKMVIGLGIIGPMLLFIPLAILSENRQFRTSKK